MAPETTQDSGRGTGIPKRTILVALCFMAAFICYMDRVNLSVAIIPMAEDYGWSGKTKGLVLSSFFIGYVLAMAPAGWLSNRYGGKLFLGIALIAWSVFTFLTPLAAGVSLGVLLLTRIAMGLGEAATFPAIYNLLARWMPVQEKTRAVALVLAGMPAGTMFALSVTGWLVESYGWQSVFYAFGIAGVLFALLWFRLIHADPSVHPSISAAERAHIERGAQAPAAAAVAVPWRALLGSRAVQALTFNHFALNWTYYLMLTWLPSYFADVQKLAVTGSGLFAMGPWISYFIGLSGGGALGDRLIARGMDVTRVRKLIVAGSFVVTGGSLLLAMRADTPGMALAILCVSLGLIGLCTSNLLTNHLDIAPRYADVLVGITNTAGTLPGIIGVALTGWLLDATGGYEATFALAAAICFAGAVIWLGWGTGRKVFD